MSRSTVLGGLLAMSLTFASVYAQECPFPDSVAIADTLDPSGYFPLDVGNQWDYIMYSTFVEFVDGLWREKVHSDTLIDGNVFWKIEVTNFVYDAEEISESSTSYRYLAVTDTSISEWRSGMLLDTPRPFSAHFNSCSSGVQIEGGYDRSFQVSIGDSLALVDSAVVKDFVGEFAEWTYVHNVGLVQAIGDPSLTTQILYVRTKNLEAGTPIENLFNVTVSVEERDSPKLAPKLAAYPNPFSDRLFVNVQTEPNLNYKLDLIDVLGRSVVILDDIGLRSGRHTRYDVDASSLPNGMYLIRLTTEGYTVVRPVIAMR